MQVRLGPFWIAIYNAGKFDSEVITEIYNNIIYLFTAVGLSPGGSGYSTCTQNMKSVTTEFKSGRLHEKHVVATWNLGNISALILCPGKPRKTCVERKTCAKIRSLGRSVGMLTVLWAGWSGVWFPAGATDFSFNPSTYTGHWSHLAS